MKTIDIPETANAEWVVENYLPDYENRVKFFIRNYPHIPGVLFGRTELKKEFINRNHAEALRAFGEAVYEATKESCQAIIDKVSDDVDTGNRDPAVVLFELYHNDVLLSAPSPIKK